MTEELAKKDRPPVRLSEILDGPSAAVAIRIDGEHPNVGVRGYGRDLFRKRPISGASTLYRAKTGQLGHDPAARRQ